MELSRVKVKAIANVEKIKSIPVVITNIPKPSDGYYISDALVNPSTIDIINTKDGGATIDHLEIKYDVSKFGKINDKTVNFTILLRNIYLKTSTLLMNLIK